MKVAVDIGTEGQGEVANLSVRQRVDDHIARGIQQQSHDLLNAVDRVLQTLLDRQQQNLQRREPDRVHGVAQVEYDRALQFLHDVGKRGKARHCVQQL